MKRNLIGNAWATYEERVLPADAPDEQKQECRRAFYGGAASLLTALVMALEPGDEMTGGDVLTMGGIEAELKEFEEAVRGGKA